MTLTCSYFTLTGAPITAPPRHTLDERAAAAAGAGFTGMALSAAELEHASLDEVVATMARHGLLVPELEPLRGWDDPATEAAGRATEEGLYALAGAFGSARVNAIQVVGDDVPAEVVAERFAALCDRAAPHGLTIAFEPRAYSAVDTPQQAAALLAASGAANAGITLDAFHFHRAGATLEGLAPALVVALQLNDLHDEPVGDAAEDALEHRLCPGDGDLDLPAWLRALRAHGVDAPVAVEVLSRAFRELDLDTAARRAAQGARAAMQEL